MSHELGQKQNVRPYIIVFVALMGLTLITVAISYLDLPVLAAIILALIVATVKGTLVACYFMHLISEKKLILVTMLLAVVFFFAVLVGPKLTALDAVTL